MGVILNDLKLSIDTCLVTMLVNDRALCTHIVSMVTGDRGQGLGCV